jgi:hypothetical protein
MYRLTASRVWSILVPAQMKSCFFVSSLVTLVTVVSAHSIFQELYVNGVDQGHMVGIRVPDYDGVRPNLDFRCCF